MTLSCDILYKTRSHIFLSQKAIAACITLMHNTSWQERHYTGDTFCLFLISVAEITISYFKTQTITSCFTQLRSYQNSY